MIEFYALRLPNKSGSYQRLSLDERKYVSSSIDSFLVSLGVDADVKPAERKGIRITSVMKPSGGRKNPLDLAAREDLARRVSAHLNGNLPFLQFKVRVD